MIKGVISGHTVTGKVYYILREAIMDLQFPPGMTMSTQEMATRLNVSRTPIREAFNYLHSEGLVEILPQKGTRVSRIDLKRVRQERFIREALEIAVMEPLMAKWDVDVIRRLWEQIAIQKDMLEQQKELEMLKADNQFHKIIFDTADQSMAWERMLDNNSHYNRIRILTCSSEEIGRGVIKQHEKIIELIMERNLPALKNEIADHVSKIFMEEKVLREKFPDYFVPEEENDILLRF